MSRSLRASVMVSPCTEKNTLHHAHGDPRGRVERNPHSSWGWFTVDGSKDGFKRAEDAKADATRVLGKIDWTPRKGRWYGEYGPEHTADEWLDKGRT